MNWRWKCTSGPEIEPGLLALAQAAATHVTKFVMHTCVGDLLKVCARKGMIAVLNVPGTWCPMLLVRLLVV